MSFNPDHNKYCEYCNCWRCQKTLKNSQEQIWLRQGFGRFDEITFNSLSVSNALEVDTIFEKPLFASHYESPEEEQKLYVSSSLKPPECLWFSNGSWLYDRYGDCDHGDLKEEAESYKVIVTQNPHNVLQISTIEELDAFTIKYADPRFNDPTQSSENILSTNYNRILWHNIYKDGYYGVAFNFRSATHIAPMESYFRKYFWHSSFDVESLCIFDLRAFQNLTIENVDF